MQRIPEDKPLPKGSGFFAPFAGKNPTDKLPFEATYEGVAYDAIRSDDYDS